MESVWFGGTLSADLFRFPLKTGHEKRTHSIASGIGALRRPTRKTLSMRPTKGAHENANTSGLLSCEISKFRCRQQPKLREMVYDLVIIGVVVDGWW